MMENRAGRQLPELEIKNLKFWVDATKMALIDVQNPDNKLRAKDMQNSEEGHSFVIDLQERKIDQTPGRTLADPERYARVHIPHMESLDTAGMWIQVAEGRVPKPETHFESVSIKGTEFYFTRDSSLQQVDNPWNVIPQSVYQKHEGKIGFWYHHGEKRVALRDEIPRYPGTGIPDQVKFEPLLDLLQNLRSQQHPENKQLMQEQKQEPGRRKGKGLGR